MGKGNLYSSAEGREALARHRAKGEKEFGQKQDARVLGVKENNGNGVEKASQVARAVRYFDRFYLKPFLSHRDLSDPGSAKIPEASILVSIVLGIFQVS
jgi:hypothetical protein